MASLNETRGRGPRVKPQINLRIIYEEADATCFHGHLYITGPSAGLDHRGPRRRHKQVLAFKG